MFPFDILFRTTLIPCFSKEDAFEVRRIERKGRSVSYIIELHKVALTEEDPLTDYLERSTRDILSNIVLWEIQNKPLNLSFEVDEVSSFTFLALCSRLDDSKRYNINLIALNDRSFKNIKYKDLLPIKQKLYINKLRFVFQYESSSVLRTCNELIRNTILDPVMNLVDTNIRDISVNGLKDYDSVWSWTKPSFPQGLFSYKCRRLDILDALIPKFSEYTAIKDKNLSHLCSFICYGVLCSMRCIPENLYCLEISSNTQCSKSLLALAAYSVKVKFSVNSINADRLLNPYLLLFRCKLLVRSIDNKWKLVDALTYRRLFYHHERYGERVMLLNRTRHRSDRRFYIRLQDHFEYLTAVKPRLFAIRPSNSANLLETA